MIPQQSPTRQRLMSVISRVFAIYSGCTMIWFAATIPLVWAWSSHPLLVTSIRILYLVATGGALTYALQRTRALRASRHEYTQLFENLLVPVMVHSGGVVVDANAHAIEFFEGASKGALVGQPIVRFIHPKDLAIVQKRITQLEAGKSTELREETFITLNGNVRDVEIVGIPVTHGGQPAVMVIFRDVTERNEAERELRESESRLRTLIHGLPDKVCFIDMKNRWVEANHEMLLSLGLAENVYRGKTLIELADLCDPRFRSDLLAGADEYTLGVAKRTRYERVLSLADGGVKIIDVRRIPVTSPDGSNLGVVVIVADVTEQRLMTKRLVESRELYRSLFENDADMIALVDRSGTIVSANPATEETVGYTPGELVGRHYLDIIAPENHEASHRWFESVMTGHREILHTSLIRRDSLRVEVFEKKIPMVVDNRVTGFFWIIRDVSAFKAAEEMMIEAERLTAVGQMAAGIAHEIRNPLTSLKGFVQLMRSTETTNALHLTVMLEELERIEFIVNELLLYAKPTLMSMQRNSLTRLIHDVIELLSPHANLRNARMSLHIDNHSIDDFLFDKNRLKQVFVNLVKNAIEAIPEGGEVDILITAPDEKTVAARISDSGPGIPEEVLERIGEPFYTTKLGGTGLGLSVSRRIIEAHRGKLHIHSKLGEGTMVEVILPTDSIPEHLA